MVAEIIKNGDHIFIVLKLFIKKHEQNVNEKRRNVK